MSRTQRVVLLSTVAFGLGLAALLPLRAHANVNLANLPTECPDKLTVNFNIPAVKGFRVGVGAISATFSSALCDPQAKAVECRYALPASGILPFYLVDYPKGLVSCKVDGRKLLWTF